jgi:hypothetical protein
MKKFYTKKSKNFPLNKAVLTAFFGFSFSVIWSQGNFTGNIESTFQYLNDDPIINAFQPPTKGLINSYMNVFYTQGGFKAGMRVESYLPRIQGYPNRFDGTGIGYRYVGYSNDKVDVTLGHFYEQFGNGLALRTYEDRALGYDNALDGARIIFKPISGFQIKGVYGKQRLSFTDGRVINSEGIVRALDGEFHVNESFKKRLAAFPVDVILGATFVSKYQADDDDALILPENVGAYGGRVKLQYKNFMLDGEYIQKEQDPSLDNGKIYNYGHAAVANFGYSKKGLGFSFSAKSVDNMSYRSDRNKELQDAFINFLPALNKTHPYNLVATLYPYATQPLGEVAYQADFIYTIKKGSKLGGKYGTTLGINASTTYRPVQHTSGVNLNDSSRVTYETRLFDKSDSLYWRDINFSITRKLNKKLLLILSYFNITINNDVAKVSNDATGIISSHIGVVEASYKINAKHNVRMELQGMFVNKLPNGNINDKGNWATALIEYTVAPSYFISFINQYNYGNPDADKRVNYPNITCGYIHESTRLMLSYGRQRAGLFCVGGVCRFVPANNGLTLSFTQSF